jgi:hypothetical protein
MSRKNRLTAALAALLAAIVIAAGLSTYDYTQAAQASSFACPPGQYCAKAYPDPSGYGTVGDITTATVIVAGDSIANGCRHEIRSSLTDAGITSAVNYWSGRPTKPGVDWALSLTRKPPVFVMELGSNDFANPGVMAGEIARLRAGLPPETVVVWVDTYNGNHLLATGWTNQQIHGSGLLVAQWYAMFAKAPWRDGYYLRDKLHPKGSVDGVTPGVGCAFLAAIIKPTIVAAVGQSRKVAPK